MSSPPKYIKDGCYTVLSPNYVENVEDDVDDLENEERNIKLEEQYNNEVKDLVKDINFTDTNFIFRNLSLAVPDFNEDKTLILNGRKDLIDSKVSQVCFFVYCLLSAFISRPAQPSILIFGDGFVGSNVVKELDKYGLSPFIKIFSRGSVKAKEWRSRGYVSNCSILHLLNGQKPDIIILCIDASQFNSFVNLAKGNNIVAKKTSIISMTFGVDRKKISSALGNVPTVFRTYIEPSNSVAKVKSRLVQNINHTLMEEDSSIGGSVESIDNTEMEFYRTMVSESNQANRDIIEGGLSHLNNEEVGAAVLLDRTNTIKNIVRLVENFYSLNGMSLDKCRYEALKNIFSLDEDKNDSDADEVDIASMLGATLSRPPSVQANNSVGTTISDYMNSDLILSLQNMYYFKLSKFQKVLAKSITEEQLHKWKNEELKYTSTLSVTSMNTLAMIAKAETSLTAPQNVGVSVSQKMKRKKKKPFTGESVLGLSELKEIFEQDLKYNGKFSYEYLDRLGIAE